MKTVVIFSLCLIIFKGAPTSGGIIRETEVKELDKHSITKNHEVQDVQSTGKEHATLQIQSIEEVRQINKICREESGVDKHIISTALRTAEVPPRDEKYLKFLACSYKKQKYTNEKGEIQYQNIKRFLSRYYSMEDLGVLDICGKLKQSENAGQNAFNALECILPKLVRLESIFDE